MVICYGSNKKQMHLDFNQFNVLHLKWPCYIFLDIAYYIFDKHIEYICCKNTHAYRSK